MAILTVENLTHTYGAHSPFEKHAVRGVSLDIQEGELLGIIGHTGSGKSTLIQHLNGLLRPNEGRVLLDGIDIWENPKKIRDVRFRVGMVFQYPEHQLFEDTIYKDIAFGPKNMGLDEKSAGTAVSISLVFLGVALTACRLFEKLAKFAGAGTLVPITGFANSIASPAMEFKTEGFVLGTCVKMFSIAGPVLTFGISASVVYGLVLWLWEVMG